MDSAESKRKLVDYNIVEDDVLEIRPITLNVTVPNGETAILENVDPFNDTVLDLKKRLGPEGLDLMPVDKQRLLMKEQVLDDVGGSDSRANRRLFECNVKDADTLDLERSKIDVTIKQPSGDTLILNGVDPRKDTLSTIQDFLSDEYYKGKDRDGTISKDQKLPLIFNGGTMADELKYLRDYGLRDDGEIISMSPMTVRVIFGAGSNEETHVLDNIDPMEEDVQNVKLLAGLGLDDIPLDKWRILHKESDLKELEDVPEANTFYDHGVGDGDTLFVRRMPISIRVRLPKGSTVNKNAVQVEDQDGFPTFVIRADPDLSDLDTVRNHILGAVGIPVIQQRLNKLLSDGSKKPLHTSGDSKLASAEVDIRDDCTLELEPMTINVKTENDKVISVEVLPFDTVGSVKQKLESNGVGIPTNKQRLMTEDLDEIGGDEDNRDSLGSDKSTLAELGVRNGQIFVVEKAKISLKIKMPNKIPDVEVEVDPKVHSVDQIREIVYEVTGLPKGYQQRFVFNSKQLDNGYRPTENESRKKRLVAFGLTENDVITLEAMSVTVVKLPKKERFLIQNLDPMKETLFDLKKRVAGKTMILASKQRMLNPLTEEEYVGDKDFSKKLYEYGILDGDDVLLEKARLNFHIILPSQERLDLTVDARNDDLQTIRDYLNKHYYEKRNVPKEDLRPMTRGVIQVLDDEPGETKLMQIGVVDDDDFVKIKPCFITIDTPTKIIHCPNADPFHDNLNVIVDFVREVGKVNTDGLKIFFQNNEMTDYLSVLYDLGIKQDTTIYFKK